jgi:hypothetical protein
MQTSHTPPATLADALDELADQMEQHPTRISFVTLSGLISRVLDGPGASAWRPTSCPALSKQIVAAIAPNGYLSTIPTVEQVRVAAVEHRAV